MYEEISKLIQAKDFSKSIELIDKLAEDDPKKYNFLGLVYFNQGMLEKAKESLERGLKYSPTDSDLLFNYGYVLKEIGSDKEAWRYLMRIHNKDWTVYDLLGDTQFKLKNLPMALRYYKRATDLADNEEMKRKFSSIQSQARKNTKIAFLCLPGLDNFLKDIVETLSLVYDVKLVVSTDGKTIAEAIKWADIIWLEWANELVVEVTNKIDKGRKRILCRLHGYESLRKDLLNSIKWNKIDRVIFVARNVLDTTLQNCEAVRNSNIRLIHNGLDLNRYKFDIRRPGPNIAFAGFFNYKKNPVLAVQILKKLSEIDSRYNIQWAGEIQDERMYRYILYILNKMRIEKNFSFVGWKKDIDRFLEDKNFFLSTSIHEGYGVAILEAVAKGIKPVIHNFYIAEEFYPKEWIFNTVDEAVEMITSDSYDSDQYRRFVEDKCSLEQQISEILEVLENVCYSSQDNHTYINFSNPHELSAIDPLRLGLAIDVKNYEEELENKLATLKAPVTHISPNELMRNAVPIMVDFLKRFIDDGIPYQQTSYYFFLKDMYERRLYTQPPEAIISKFLELFEVVKQDKKILKPIVVFVNDDNLRVIDPVRHETLKLPHEIKYLVASGRHRVAIAKYLGFDFVPAYVVLNRFVRNDQVYQILVADWTRYLNEDLPSYENRAKQLYIGAFDGTYQNILDPSKKRIIQDFVNKVKPRRLIDIGCNRGELSYEFSKQGIEVIGIDISPKERLNLPPDYNFIQVDVANEELPVTGEVILFLSVYHHIFYNYGKERADEVFHNLLSKCRYLVFDSGHPEETGIYRQGWITKLKQHFRTEKELFDHFTIPYTEIGKWRTPQGIFRTIVVFENLNFQQE
ncbi:MAG: glycosyltransferase [Pseudothermotoga sp.]